jgi:hypothetical protein
MHFEQSLLASEQAVRAALHQSVREGDEKAAAVCLDKLARVERLGDVALDDSPTLARGRRRLEVLRLASDGHAAELDDAIARNDAVAVRELIAHAP